MKKDKLIYAYAALMGMYWMSYGVIISFTAVFLLDHGFSDGNVGLLLAFSSLLSVALQPVIAGIADRSQRFTLKTTTMLLCFLTLFPAALLAIPNLSIGLVAGGYSLLILLHLSIQPLLNALGMQMIQEGVPLNFGVARGMGSLSYSVLTFFLGALTVRFSTQCLPFLAFVLAVFMLLLLRVFPVASVVQEEKAQRRGMAAVLKKHRRFALLILGIALIFISHSAINNYMIQILERIGKGNKELGQIMAYEALLEVPAMLLFSRIVRRWDCGKLIRITGIFFVLKALVVAGASNLFLLYAGLFFQIVSFALFTPASVYYVSRILGREDQVKGQALITIGITAGNTLGSLSGGYLIEFMGVSPMLWITGGICVAGMLFFIFGAEKTGEVM